MLLFEFIYTQFPDDLIDKNYGSLKIFLGKFSASIHLHSVNSEELFRRLLGLEESWIIREIRFDHQERSVNIFIDFPGGI